MTIILLFIICSFWFIVGFFVSEKASPKDRLKSMTEWKVKHPLTREQIEEMRMPAEIIRKKIDIEKELNEN